MGNQNSQQHGADNYLDTASDASSGIANNVSAAQRRASATHLTADEISSLPLVSHFAYARFCEWVYKDPGQRPLPPGGWSVLLDASECRLDREGYYGCAFVNDRLRSCVIAQRGTTTAEGLRAGIWVYFDEQTIQFHLAAQFSKLVRLRLQMRRPGCLPEDDMSDLAAGPNSIYTISYTGHSLGAVLAACRAAEEHTHAVTFESPGCKKFVEQTMHPFKAEDVDVITYLRNPNPINSLKPHCGFLVQLPSHADDPKKITDIKKATTTTTASASASSDAASSSASSSTSQKKQQQPQKNSSPLSSSASNGGKKPAPVAAPSRLFQSGMPASFSQMWGARDFFRVRLLENAFPELQSYLTKLEPALREMLDYTTQAHSIQSICDIMEEAERTGGQGQQVVLRWPENLLQFTEYYNIIRELNLIWEKTETRDGGGDRDRKDLVHALGAYKAFLSKLWLTEARPKHKIALRFLNRHSRTLLELIMATSSSLSSTAAAAGNKRDSSSSSSAANAITGGEEGGGASHHVQQPIITMSVVVPFASADEDHSARAFESLPISARDRKVLRTVVVESDNLVSSALTAFQMKQFLGVMTQRASVRTVLEKWAAARAAHRSKL